MHKQHVKVQYHLMSKITIKTNKTKQKESDYHFKYSNIKKNRRWMDSLHLGASPIKFTKFDWHRRQDFMEKKYLT